MRNDFKLLIADMLMRLCQVESPLQKADSLARVTAPTFEFILHFVMCDMVSVTKSVILKMSISSTLS